jgi:hypothetical protein
VQADRRIAGMAVVTAAGLHSMNSSYQLAAEAGNLAVGIAVEEDSPGLGQATRTRA